QLPWPASFLHPVSIANLVWAESVCTADASGSGQHGSGLAGVEIRSRHSAAGRAAGGPGHGSLARVHLLRSLFHSRGLAPSFFHDVYPRAAWPLARRNAE